MFPLRKALNWASSDPLALRLVPPRTVLHHFSLMDQFVPPPPSVRPPLTPLLPPLPPPRLLPPTPRLQPQGALLPVRPAPESEPESEPPLPLASVAAGRRDFDAAGACVLRY